jgi:predicted ester cyclase
MSREIKALVRRGWIAWATGDEAALTECLAPGWREYDGDGNVTDNLDGALAEMRLHRRPFPDKRLEIQHILGEGDLVAMLVTARATHTGRYFDVEPTGREVRTHMLTINRVVDGRLAESWTMYGGPGFYEQLTGRRSPPV